MCPSQPADSSDYSTLSQNFTNSSSALVRVLVASGNTRHPTPFCCCLHKGIAVSALLAGVGYLWRTRMQRSQRHSAMVVPYTHKEVTPSPAMQRNWKPRLSYSSPQAPVKMKWNIHLSQKSYEKQFSIKKRSPFWDISPS